MNITISGNTATITTSITPEQITKVAKLNPDLLIVKDPETKKGIFAVTAGTGKGSISNTGAVFVPGVNGKLVVEVGLPTGTTEEQAKDALFTYVAKSKAYIEEVEQRIADNIDDLIEAEKDFLDSIAIV